MNYTSSSAIPTSSITRHYPLWKTAVGGALAGIFISIGALPKPAHAVDGCLVLLCFAAPNWSAIPQCVPPIQQVLRDLARGRPFPSCSMSGAGNNASHKWSSAPAYCPPQYTRTSEYDGSASYTCDYDGAVEVTIDGGLWTRTWWNRAGSSVTEYTSVAKAQLGTWDTRFEDDYARWLAAQPPAPPSCDICS